MTKTRTVKTPAQRAQEALDVAQRLVDRLSEKVDHLEVQHYEAKEALRSATKRRDYLRENPDLPQAPKTPMAARSGGSLTTQGGTLANDDGATRAP